MRRLSWFVLPVALLAACVDPNEKDPLRGADDTGAGDTDGTGDDTDTADTDTGPIEVLPIEHCGVIEADETWHAADVHQITCDVDVLRGVLTIEPGTTVYVGEGEGVEVGGGDVEAGLVLAGTADAPIVLRPVEAAGEGTRWGGLAIRGNATGVTLSHVQILDAGGTRIAGLDVEGTEVAVDHVTVDGAALCGVELLEGGALAAGATGLVVTGSGGAGVCTDVAAVHTLPAEDSAYTGNAYDHIEVSGSDLVDAVTWADLGVPYAITQSFSLGNTADFPTILTLEPGVVMAMADGTKMTFSRSGGASGLIAEDVLFTALGAAVPGSWRGLVFESGVVPETSLVNVTIEYGGGNDELASLRIADSVALLRDVTVTDSLSSAILLDGSAQLAAGSGGIVATRSALPLTMVPNAVGSLPSDIDLSGNTEDVILLDGEGDVYLSATWGAYGWDYRVDTNINVAGAADTPVYLTLDADVTLRFHNDRRLTVGDGGAAALVARGTSSAPVRFLPYEAYTSGAWGGIAFDGGTLAVSVLDHFEIGWGGGYQMDGGIVIDHSDPTISNGYVHDSGGYGMAATCTSTLPTDMTWSDNFSGDVTYSPC